MCQSFFHALFLMHTCVGCFSKCSIIRLSSLHIEQESLLFHKDQPAALNWMEDAVTSVSQIQTGIDVFVLKECSLRVTMPLLAKEVHVHIFFSNWESFIKYINVYSPYTTLIHFALNPNDTSLSHYSHPKRHFLTLSYTSDYTYTVKLRCVHSVFCYFFPSNSKSLSAAICTKPRKYGAMFQSAEENVSILLRQRI